MFHAIIDLFGKYFPAIKRFKRNKEPYPDYVSSCPIVKQGTYTDKEDNVQYTLISKKNLEIEKISLPGVCSMKDMLKFNIEQIIEEQYPRVVSNLVTEEAKE